MAIIKHVGMGGLCIIERPFYFIFTRDAIISIYT